MTTSNNNQEFEALLDYLKQNWGCDLTIYKRNTLIRRFQRRMQKLKIENYENYEQYLQNSPREITFLLDSILINYSIFFRDRYCWDYLAQTILPQIITNKQPHEKIRVWSAGCAAGQEVYTLVMLLAEALGTEQYLQRVQLFATDIDEDALKEARRASFSKQDVADIPSKFLSKYFEQNQQRYIFHYSLRSSIIFARHDLTKHAPMSNIDLLVCRNVLIYFQPQSQASILVRFRFSLNNQGFLFLGTSESMTQGSEIFTPVSTTHRIFVKGEHLSLEEHLLIIPRVGNNKAVNLFMRQLQIWKTTFESSPFSQLVIGCGGRLLLANTQAYTLFGFNVNDLGRQVQEMEMGKLLNLWTYMNQLENNRSPISLKNRKWVTNDIPTYLDIYITPISDVNGQLLAANLTFIDVTRSLYVEDELERLNSDLTKVTQELKDKKEQLNNTNIVLESTQKELESVHQEMEFRNEL